MRAVDSCDWPRTGYWLCYYVCVTCLSGAASSAPSQLRRYGLAHGQALYRCLSIVLGFAVAYASASTSAIEPSTSPRSCLAETSPATHGSFQAPSSEEPQLKPHHQSFEKPPIRHYRPVGLQYQFGPPYSALTTNTPL